MKPVKSLPQFIEMLPLELKLLRYYESLWKTAVFIL